jgi:hypothetical protein
MKTFDHAQLAIDSVLTHAAVVTISSIYRHIILPGLKDSKGLSNGFYEVERTAFDFTGCREGSLFGKGDAKKDAWRIFKHITLNPLDRDSKKLRSLNVSSPLCVAESISQIRRMLLVRSSNNSHNIFSAMDTHSSEFGSAEEFAQADVLDQYRFAGLVYFDILRTVLTECNGVVQVQIQSDLKSNFRLQIWGGFN